MCVCVFKEPIRHTNHFNWSTVCVCVSVCVRVSECVSTSSSLIEMDRTEE